MRPHDWKDTCDGTWRSACSSPEGPGSSARIFATGCWRTGRKSSAPTISSPAPAANVEQPAEAIHAFELLRHDITFPLYVEVDKIYNLACPASPVITSTDPVQTTKTSVNGAINMLGLRQAADRRESCRPRPRKSNGDPTTHPQTERLLGHVNPSDRVPVRRGSACARRCLRLLAQHRAIRWRAIFHSPTGPRIGIRSERPVWVVGSP